MASVSHPQTSESIKQIEYEVPLSDAELLDLGRTTAIISQIDFMLTEALSGASKSPAWAVYVFAEKATMSAKIGMFEKLLGGTEQGDAKTLGKKLVKTLHKVNDDRNVLFHGMWTLHFDPKTEKGWPTCIWQNKKPIRPAELPEIAARAAYVTRQLGDYLGKMNPKLAEPKWSKPRRLFMPTENVDLKKIVGGGLVKASF